MNMKIVIIVLVALLAVGVGGYYLTKDDNDSNNAVLNTGSTSINALLGQNNNSTCTYSHTDESGNTSSGTVYLSGGRMRGNFTFQAAGQQTQYSNVLRDNEYQFVWQDGSDTGFKSKIETLTSAGSDDSNTTQQAVDQDKEYDFDCSDWRVDESMFNAPANVEFTDYSAQIQQSQEAQQNVNDIKSEACAQISDATARMACENAL